MFTGSFVWVRKVSCSDRIYRCRVETLEEMKEADISVFIEAIKECGGLMAGSKITIFIIGAVVILALILAVGILSFYCRVKGATKGRKDSELANCRKTGGPEESPEPLYDYLDDVIENAAVTMAVLTEPHYVENMVDPEPGEPQYVENIVIVDPVLNPDCPEYVRYNPARGTAAGNRSYMNVELNSESVKPTDTSEYLEMNRL